MALAPEQRAFGRARLVEWSHCRRARVGCALGLAAKFGSGVARPVGRESGCNSSTKRPLTT